MNGLGTFLIHFQCFAYWLRMLANEKLLLIHLSAVNIFEWSFMNMKSRANALLAHFWLESAFHELTRVENAAFDPLLEHQIRRKLIFRYNWKLSIVFKGWSESLLNAWPVDQKLVFAHNSSREAHLMWIKYHFFFRKTDKGLIELKCGFNFQRPILYLRKMISTQTRIWIFV